MPATIEIGVHGGCVQWVKGIPGGIEVRVHDYDIDGVDSSILSTDDEGHPCLVVIYRSDAGSLGLDGEGS